MRIGKLSEHTGLSRDALRFYEKKGLLKSRRGANGYRDYPEETVALVNLIRLAQQLGFSLAEMAEHLPALWTAPDREKAIAQLVSDKLRIIDGRIAELTALRDRLAGQLGCTCPFTTTQKCE